LFGIFIEKVIGVSNFKFVCKSANRKAPRGAEIALLLSLVPLGALFVWIATYMECIKWKSRTTDAKGEMVGHINRGERDMVQSRRDAKLQAMNKDRRQKIIKLCESGSKIGNKLCAREKERDSSYVHMCSCFPISEVQHFFRKGVERRTNLSSEERNLKIYNALERKQNVAKNHEQLFELEFGKHCRAVLRDDRVNMRLAEEESLDQELQLRASKDCSARIQAARDFMSRKFQQGFNPCQAHGRREYFSRIGISKRTAKLNVS